MDPPKLVPVLFLKEGDEGIIETIAGGRSLVSRLASMGIARSTRIRVLRSGGGLSILDVAGTRVALGAGEAEKILVLPVTPVNGTAPAPERKKYLVALAGQPNVGKSTVFNILTGLSQHVGNWPGKTVEKKIGAHVFEDMNMEIVDLPGTYSLSALSEEERISRDFIITEYPDVIVLLVNAAALERSLYLLAELLLLGPPVIAAVNMMDVAEAQGIRIDTKALQRSLGIPVVAMIASKNRGIRELVKQISALLRGETVYDPRMPYVAEDHRAIHDELLSLVQEGFRETASSQGSTYNPQWIAIKLMEGDSEVFKTVEHIIPAYRWAQIQNLLLKHEDSHHAVVGGRYDWIEEITRAAVSRYKLGQILVTDRIDHVLTRPIFGIPALIGIFGLIFSATYTIGFPLQRWLEQGVGYLGKGMSAALISAPSWIRGLVADGVIGGVGSVITLLPILLIFFGFMAILEDTGYMARAAYVMDRFMHVIGLHGKSFFPLCLGFGCNVPAVLGTRIVESKKERLLTVFLSPFIPCTAKLGVLTFVAAAMFSNKATFVTWSLLSANILVLGLVGIAAHWLFLKGEPVPFIMELPLYHKPDPRLIATVIWMRTLAFIRRAGTVILSVSIAVWALAYFPEAAVGSSFLARIGHSIEPIGTPLGMDWRMITALLTSVVAKENAVATLSVLYNVSDRGLIQVLPLAVTHASALAFLVVLMLFIPCAATLVAMKREMQSWKWFAASLGTMIAISYLGGALAYHLALWIGL
jgi:ferrous iron transport protein B